MFEKVCEILADKDVYKRQALAATTPASLLRKCNKLWI